MAGAVGDGGAGVGVGAGADGGAGADAAEAFPAGEGIGDKGEEGRRVRHELRRVPLTIGLCLGVTRLGSGVDAQQQLRAQLSHGPGEPSSRERRLTTGERVLSQLE